MKATDVRKGHVILIEGQPCRVMDFTHRTPGNLRAFVQVRFRNLISGNTFDTRLNASDFVDQARLDTKEMQVLYQDGQGTHVMDQDTFDQVTLDQEVTGDLTPWLQPEMKFMVEWLGGKPIAINLPSTIELEVVETAPIMKTATKTASTKPATYFTRKNKPANTAPAGSNATMSAKNWPSAKISRWPVASMPCGASFPV